MAINKSGWKSVLGAASSVGGKVTSTGVIKMPNGGNITPFGGSGSRNGTTYTDPAVLIKNIKCKK